MWLWKRSGAAPTPTTSAVTPHTLVSHKVALFKLMAVLAVARLMQNCSGWAAHTPQHLPECWGVCGRQDVGLRAAAAAAAALFKKKARLLKGILRAAIYTGWILGSDLADTALLCSSCWQHHISSLKTVRYSVFNFQIYNILITTRQSWRQMCSSAVMFNFFII